MLTRRKLLDPGLPGRWAVEFTVSLWRDQSGLRRKRLNVESADITKLSVTATLRRMSRLLLVALSIVAWFSISNHCVIGALKTSKSMQAACHGDGAAPTKLPAKGEPVSCCKVLRATLAKTNTNVAVDALV